MRVYRVERLGYGPYVYHSPMAVTDEKLNKLIDKHENNQDRWPVAMMDGIPFSMANGCDSLKSLVSWFDGMMGSLVRCGFRIRIYDVDSVNVVMGYSGKQLGFNHADIRKVIR